MKEDGWEKAKKIFADAIKLSPELRLQYINEVCAGDLETRREVESLLISFEDAESFMEKPVAEEFADVIKGNVKKLKRGKCFGHYEIIKQIGAGGMGEVYLAHDQRLERKVAVKILNEKLARHESNLKRFFQEAKAASSLNHPNILVIHEFGESEDGHFIVSEYVEGKTLREIFKESPMKLSKVLDVVIQIAGALVAAHKAGIIHRDIKPENIIVRSDGYAKILDFGLAKLIEQKGIGLEEPTLQQNQTAKGVILGTVNYLSPEQAKAEKVDERTDIFSLGTVIYEMIAGRTPFAGNSVSETFANLINTEPQPLSRFAANVPDELQRIVSKTLRKNADERYQTMNDLFLDLKSLQKRLEFETEFEMKSSFDTTAKTRELKAEKTISPPQNSVAVLPFANISADNENEYFCEGLAEELISALSKIEDLRVAARTSAFSFKGKRTEVSEIGKALNVNKILEGSVRKSGNRLRINIQLVNALDGFHIWSERFDGEMRDIFDLQDEIALAVVDKLKVKFLSEEKEAILKRHTNDPKAYEYYLKGMYYRWKLTPEEFGRCGDYFHRAADADPTFALAYFGLNSYYGYGTAWGLLSIPPGEGWAKAEAAITKGLEIDPTLPELQLSLAALKLINYREFDEAGKRIERAVAANSKLHEIHHIYSFYLLLAGRFNEAIDECEQALRLDPLSLNYSSSLGRCFYHARRYDEAVAQFKKALELDPNNSSIHEFLGEIYQKQEKFEEASSAWRRALTLEGEDELAAIFQNASAEAEFARAFKALARKKIERLNEKAGNGEFVLAIKFTRAFVMLGETEQAFHWLEKAVEERNVFPLLMNRDPFYDSLRADPRFQDMLRRVGFPVDKNAKDKTTKEAKKETLRLKTAADSAATHSKAGKPTVTEITKNLTPVFTAGLIILLLGAIGLGYYFWSAKKPALSGGGKKSLAILPFVNASQDPNAEYLSDGITESIINNLSQISGLKVMSRNSAFRFKQNQTDTKNIASQLGVETLVTGDIKQVGDKLVINVRLIDASDDTQIWGNQYVKTTADIIAAQNEIAQAVASNLRLKLTSTEQRQLGKNYTVNPEAYQLYLRGRFHLFKLTPPEVNKGISYFQQAIEIDPNYALAYAGISHAYRALALGSEMPPGEFLSKAKAAADKAIKIDSSLSESYESLGSTAFWQWDWHAAENHYTRALELNSNNALAHLFYAHLLSNTGRHAEAIAEVKLARELDPLFPFANALEGQFLLHAGRVDEALERLQKTFELEPNFWMPHLFTSSAYIEKGMYPEAIAEARKASELSAFQTASAAHEAYTLAKSGKSDQARNILNGLLKLSNERFVPPYHIALIYNGLGETDETFAWLERAYQQRDPKMTFLKVEPKWNNLRSEPRFIELMRRIGFSQ